jgi:hypothetical protein
VWSEVYLENSLIDCLTVEKESKSFVIQCPELKKSSLFKITNR